MYDLEYAKNIIMNDKKFFRGLEIFSIRESKNEWFFVINGVKDDGDIIMIQPYERAFNKSTGEVRDVFSQKEDKTINLYPQIYCRQSTYKESHKIIVDCYKEYIITSSYESTNYHMFNILCKPFKLSKTLLIHRFSGKIIELNDENKNTIENEKFIKLS